MAYEDTMIERKLTTKELGQSIGLLKRIGDVTSGFQPEVQFCPLETMLVLAILSPLRQGLSPRAELKRQIMQIEEIFDKLNAVINKKTA